MPSNRHTRVVGAGLVSLLALLAGCATPAPRLVSPPPTTSLRPVTATDVAADAPGPTPSTGGIRPGTRFTPIAVSVLTVPRAVKSADGRFHLAYELILTNATRTSVRIDRLRVRRVAPAGPGHTTRRVVQSLTAARLWHATNPLGGESAKGQTTLAASSTWTVWMDVSFATKAAVPTRMDHRFTGTITTPDGRRFPLDAVVARMRPDRAAPVVLGAPVLHGTWYASDSCCTHDTHHRRGLVPINGNLQVPQRYAIDWYRLDAKHRSWVGDPTKLTNYLTYREPVIAAAGGTVVAARDGLPNSKPPEPPTIPPILETVGNHVIVRIAPGTYVLYSHFDPGTVKVHVGQHVRKRQLLGLIGTSGNSTTPHLHFQVLTKPTFFSADSPPFVFDRFTLVGQVTKRIWDDNIGLQPTPVLPFVAAKPRTVHHNEMPLDRNVIRFGPAEPRRSCRR